MISKRLIFCLFFFLFFLLPYVYPQDKKVNADLNRAEQQIGDFSLSGYEEKGKKSWDISGKTADIMDEAVALSEVVGNLYGEQENIKLRADKGDFEKNTGRVNLEDNVIITTSSGAQLTTDSLQWDRKAKLISTDDEVNIKKENMHIIASGARGNPDLKRVSLEKEVKVDIEQNKEGILKTEGRIIINCDGPLEIDYEKNIASFKNNVKVTRSDSVIYSDFLDIYFSKDKNKDANSESDALGNSKIDKIVARGNVKVIQGENVSYSQEAVYTAFDKKLVLVGNPKLVIYSTENFNNALTGN